MKKKARILYLLASTPIILNRQNIQTKTFVSLKKLQHDYKGEHIKNTYIKQV
jgi:hypothetical protein